MKEIQKKVAIDQENKKNKEIEGLKWKNKKLGGSLKKEMYDTMLFHMERKIKEGISETIPFHA